VRERAALAPRRLPESPWRNARGAVEGADEVREIAEADVERDLGDRPCILGEEASRAPEPGAHQVLVRSHAEDLPEEAQEVERAEPDFGRGPPEIDGLLRASVDPERRLDRTAAVTKDRSAF